MSKPWNSKFKRTVSTQTKTTIRFDADYDPSEMFTERVDYEHEHEHRSAKHEHELGSE